MLTTTNQIRNPVIGSPVLDADALWASLRAGREVIIASFCTEAECHLELERAPHPAPLGEQHGVALDLLLRGASQKFIAFETARSASTVALRLRRSLECLGLYCGASSVPTALINIAQVAWGRLPLLIGRSIPVLGRPQRRLISLRRPNPRALRILSPAEAHVVDLFVEGSTRSQIVSVRRTSPRTLANQVSQVYKKLQLTGRIPLVIRSLQAESSAQGESPAVSALPDIWRT